MTIGSCPTGTLPIIDYVRHDHMIPVLTVQANSNLITLDYVALCDNYLKHNTVKFLEQQTDFYTLYN